MTFSFKFNANSPRIRVVFIYLICSPEKGCLLFDVARGDKILLKKMFNVTPIGFNAELQSFSECENGFLNGLLGYFVPNIFKHCFELIFILRFWGVLLIFLQYCTPNMIVEWIEIWLVFALNLKENVMLYCLSRFVIYQFDKVFRKNAITS